MRCCVLTVIILKCLFESTVTVLDSNITDQNNFILINSKSLENPITIKRTTTNITSTEFDLIKNEEEYRTKEESVKVKEDRRKLRNLHRSKFGIENWNLTQSKNIKNDTPDQIVEKPKEKPTVNLEKITLKKERFLRDLKKENNYSYTNSKIKQKRVSLKDGSKKDGRKHGVIEGDRKKTDSSVHSLSTDNSKNTLKKTLEKSLQETKDKLEKLTELLKRVPVLKKQSNASEVILREPAQRMESTDSNTNLESPARELGYQLEVTGGPEGWNSWWGGRNGGNGWWDSNNRWWKGSDANGNWWGVGLGASAKQGYSMRFPGGNWPVYSSNGQIWPGYGARGLELERYGPELGRFEPTGPSLATYRLTKPEFGGFGPTGPDLDRYSPPGSSVLTQYGPTGSELKDFEPKTADFFAWPGYGPRYSANGDFTLKKLGNVETQGDIAGSLGMNEGLDPRQKKNQDKKNSFGKINNSGKSEPLNKNGNTNMFKGNSNQVGHGKGSGVVGNMAHDFIRKGQSALHNDKPLKVNGKLTGEVKLKVRQESGDRERLRGNGGTEGKGGKDKGRKPAQVIIHGSVFMKSR